MGIPVMLTPSNRSQTIITNSTDTFIKFADPGMTCPPTWGLTGDSGRMYLSTGLNVPFRITPTGKNVYAIFYYPDPETGLGVGGLTFFDEDGTRWLGLTFNNSPRPISVYFIKKGSVSKIM